MGAGGPEARQPAAIRFPPLYLTHDTPYIHRSTPDDPLNAPLPEAPDEPHLSE
jgi:hypothetical protein